MRTVRLPSGIEVPALGQGTWFMAERRQPRSEEIAALQHGIDLGMTLIDTAEMYADGAAETLVGEAIAGRRSEVFLVSKVYPWNASRRGTKAACEASLRRLGTDRIDLYLLHWRGNHPFADTVEAMEQLVDEGKIRHWGVSNLDVDDLDELWGVDNGERCQVDQVLYNLTRRGPEFDLLPWARGKRMPLMAYSPIEQGQVPVDGALADVADKHGATPLQVALAWVLRQPDVIAIPKSGRREHVELNRAALDLVLDEDDLARLDAEFPVPRRKQPLEML
ncbi:aldo/keto reductase [Crenobacter sp. SG2305]|uniref:aldo/keto reductase n=1 Tax=Crenobacter oryzisoli TaxID=3056844 RepID=UPI0025AA69E9|nr:aldo/keto reductase [Crenobacter sp. SG2305]MDN0081762.1 aldo/keto reductase [Crenobacter sp. SG2305]